MSWTHDYGFHVFERPGLTPPTTPPTPFWVLLVIGSAFTAPLTLQRRVDGTKLVPVAKLIVNSPLAANV